MAHLSAPGPAGLSLGTTGDDIINLAAFLRLRRQQYHKARQMTMVPSAPSTVPPIVPGSSGLVSLAVTSREGVVEGLSAGVGGAGPGVASLRGKAENSSGS